MRMTPFILIAKGKAEDVFDMKTNYEDIPAAEIAQLVEAEKIHGAYGES